MRGGKGRGPRITQIKAASGGGSARNGFDHGSVRVRVPIARPQPRLGIVDVCCCFLGVPRACSFIRRRFCCLICLDCLNPSSFRIFVFMESCVVSRIISCQRSSFGRHGGRPKRGIGRASGCRPMRGSSGLAGLRFSDRPWPGAFLTVCGCFIGVPPGGVLRRVIRAGADRGRRRRGVRAYI